MPSPSEAPSKRSRHLRRLRITVALVVLAVAVPVVGVAAAVINTGRYVVDADAVQLEDAYVAANSATVEGRIEGDLVIATGSLEISGVVAGDVLVAARGSVIVSGTVEGSVRGVARSVTVSGSVGDDVAVAAVMVDVDGVVTRDFIGLGARGQVDGRVGRDILGRFLRLEVGAEVGRDVDVTVRDLVITSPGVVGGDVVYQADSDAQVDAGATIAGQIIQVPAGAPFPVRFVLDLAAILGFFGYLVGGVVLLWLLRRTSADAVAAVAQRPGLTLGVGAGVAVGGPVVIAALVATLVGIPLALAGLLLIVSLLLFGSVPLVTAVGARALSDRGGAYGGFLLGAVVWRIVAIVVPLLGAVLFVLALVWGSGGWVVGAWRARAAAPAVG
jgi:cytoskeletal protein CcmA (bactofilin family)